MKQVSDIQHMQLHAHAADDADAFAEIDLRVARGMGEPDEDLNRETGRCLARRAGGS